MLQHNTELASMIYGLGSYLPAEMLSNDDLAPMIDTSDEWVRSRTGIGFRHRAAPHETTASMGVEAAKIAMKNAGILPNDIDMIVFGTMFPEYTYPGPGMAIQHKLGISKPIPVFDLRVQCAGFIFALSMADLYIRSGQAKYALIVFSEREFDHFKVDRQIGVIFGDGGGAAIVGPAKDSRGTIVTDLHGDGAGLEELVMTSDNMVGLAQGNAYWPEELQKTKAYWEEKGMIPGHTKFPFWIGGEVFKKAVKRLACSVKETLNTVSLEKTSVDHYFFHQANARINAKLTEVLGLPEDRIPSNIERIGNLGAASIPILMHEEQVKGRLKIGDVCLLSAFGAGYLWGSALIRF